MPVAQAVPAPYVPNFSYAGQPRVEPQTPTARQKRPATQGDSPATPRPNKTPREKEPTETPAKMDMCTQTDIHGPVVTLAECQRMSKAAADKATADVRSA